MRGLVLAAGRGSRLGPSTQDRPKCLVAVDGRTLLDRQVSALRAGGASEVGVVTGWCRDAFVGYGLPTFVNERWAETTMVDSLACASPWLTRGVVLVSYGDLVYSRATVRRLAAEDADVVIAYDPDWRRLWEERFADPLSDAETFRLGADGRVLDIGARPKSIGDVQGQYMGLLRLTPSGWAELRRVLAESDDRPDMTMLLRRTVQSGRRAVIAVMAEGPWYEFDHPTDLERGLPVIRWLDSTEGRVG